ncbi:MAG: hypothetical protein IJK01_10705 [Clostridia bacterium]|nr:hypothetical protein [Clostridia bacterium]
MDQDHFEAMTPGVRQQLLILLAGVGLLLGSGNGFVGIDLIDLHSAVLGKLAAGTNLRGRAHFRLIVRTEPGINLSSMAFDIQFSRCLHHRVVLSLH